MYFTEPQDYKISPHQQRKVIFPAGTTRAFFDVFIVGDNRIEPNETFRIIIVSLSLPYGVYFGSNSVSSAVALILDNDSELDDDSKMDDDSKLDDDSKRN